eukprot:scaffold22025_cov134-Skeletonema_dohrnii-CCMP3373.AAC.2
MGQERPYHSDSTASRLLSEVKHCRARYQLQPRPSLYLFAQTGWHGMNLHRTPPTPIPTRRKLASQDITSRRRHMS